MARPRNAPPEVDLTLDEREQRIIDHARLVRKVLNNDDPDEYSRRCIEFEVDSAIYFLADPIPRTQIEIIQVGFPAGRAFDSLEKYVSWLGLDPKDWQFNPNLSIHRSPLFQGVIARGTDNSALSTLAFAVDGFAARHWITSGEAEDLVALDLPPMLNIRVDFTKTTASLGKGNVERPALRLSLFNPTYTTIVLGYALDKLGITNAKGLAAYDAAHQLPGLGGRTRQRAKFPDPWTRLRRWAKYYMSTDGGGRRSPGEAEAIWGRVFNEYIEDDDIQELLNERHRATEIRRVTEDTARPSKINICQY